MARDFEDIFRLDDLSDDDLRALVREQLTEYETVDADNILVTATNGEVVLAIADDGIGIDSEATGTGLSMRSVATRSRKRSMTTWPIPASATANRSAVGRKTSTTRRSIWKRISMRGCSARTMCSQPSSAGRRGTRQTSRRRRDLRERLGSLL